MKKITLNVEPMGAPRMTRADSWRKRPCVLKYRIRCDELRAEAKRNNFDLHCVLPDIVFYIPMPKSWTKKKKVLMLGKPHKQKPDLDNLLKFWIDGLQKSTRLMQDDCEIHTISSVKKAWSEKGYIEIG